MKTDLDKCPEIKLSLQSQFIKCDGRKLADNWQVYSYLTKGGDFFRLMIKNPQYSLKNRFNYLVSAIFFNAFFPIWRVKSNFIQYLDFMKWLKKVSSKNYDNEYSLDDFQYVDKKQQKEDLIKKWKDMGLYGSLLDKDIDSMSDYFTSTEIEYIKELQSERNKDGKK